MTAWIRNTVAYLALALAGYATISLTTGFQHDARVSAFAAAGLGLVWLAIRFVEENRVLNGILAADRPEHLEQVPLDDVEFDDELPWVVRDGDRRPHWDTDVMGGAGVMPALFDLFCDRCGKYFQAATASLECPACLYALFPQRAVLGYAQRAPLTKKLVTT